MRINPHNSSRQRLTGRLVALGVFAICAGALVYVHRDDIWPTAPAPRAEDTAFVRCFEDSAAKIGKMRTEGLIVEAQARRFRDRAEARCRAQTGGNAGPPSLPVRR